MNDIKQQLKETLGNINKSSSNKNHIVLKLKTLTPLYTGGIGQKGDQIHPSNLLGGIRHFSCLVARFLGEKDFEKKVWGTAEESEPKAKQIALKWEWDTLELNNIKLTNVIEIPYVGKNNKYKKSQWRFNSAFEGNLTLQISKRDKDIKEKFWNILLISIAIQIRYAMFGSKDQFGLGVLGLVNPEDFKKFPKLNIPLNEVKDDFLDKEKKLMNLKRYAFAKVKLKKKKEQKEQKYINFNDETKLKLGLAMRYNLRDALRTSENASKLEYNKWKRIRHKMFGDSKDKCNSCVNISAAYGNEENPEIRITVELNLEKESERDEVLDIITDKEEIAFVNQFINDFGYEIDENNINWEFGGNKNNENKVDWLNELAGAL